MTDDLFVCDWIDCLCSYHIPRPYCPICLHAHWNIDEVGDLSTEIDKRVKNRVADFTGKDEYSFGDITKEIENRRQKWVSDFLGEEAAKNYGELLS